MVVPCTTKVALGVELLIVKLPEGVRLIMVAPVEVLLKCTTMGAHPAVSSAVKLAVSCPFAKNGNSSSTVNKNLTVDLIIGCFLSTKSKTLPINITFLLELVKK